MIISDRIKKTDRNVMYETKSGMLTDYAFSCGGVHRYTLGENKVWMFKEHNTYHVRFSGPLFLKLYPTNWFSFESITEARKCFKAHKNLMDSALKAKDSQNGKN